MVNGDIVDNISNQTIFQNNTNNFQFQDVNSTITPPLEMLSNKAEESNVSYIYPKKVNKTEELIIGRTERKLYTKDEYGNDILLIFSSPLEIVNKSYKDSEIKVGYNQTQSNFSNVTLSQEYVKDKYIATYNKETKTSEKTLIKEFIDNDKEYATSDSTINIAEDTNKNLLKRLTNFSKLRYKKINLTRSNPVKVRISNHTFDKINSTHKANTTVSKTEKVKSSLHKNDLLLKIPQKNNTENIPKMQINTEIENTSTSKDNITSTEIDKSYSAPLVHSNILNTLKIVKEKNDETTADLNGVKSKLKKIDSFHVDMISFTLDDAMVALDQSGSELRNYWTKPDTKNNNNIENLQDIIRDKVMNVHKNLKQKQLMKNKKVTFTNNGGKKYGLEDPKQLSSFKHIQDLGTHYYEQDNFNIHLGKSMNKRSDERISLSEPRRPLTENQLIKSVMGAWDYIQETRNKEFMHSLIPIPETVAPTANNGLLIVGPLPKSLPQHFKSEPFKDQLQLPGA